jgi:hypothetical protein
VLAALWPDEPCSRWFWTRTVAHSRRQLAEWSTPNVPAKYLLCGDLADCANGPMSGPRSSAGRAGRLGRFQLVVSGTGRGREQAPPILACPSTAP